MRRLAGSLVLFVLAACGTPARSPDAEATASAPGASSSEAAADAPPASSGDTAADPKASTGAPDSETASLARELMKSGGRRIGWSSSKKSFVFPTRRRSGESASLDIIFTDDAGHPKDTLRVCQAGECDEQMAEKTKETLPKLTARLDEGSFVAVRAIGWPSGQDDLDVSSLRMKLRNSGGRLEGLRDGKPSVKLGSVKPPVILALYVVTDDKKLGIFSANSADAGETDQVFSVLNLP